MKTLLPALSTLALLGACQSPAEPDPVPEVDPVAIDSEDPLPDYPRPTLVRNRWQSLNGTWGYEPGNETQPPPLRRHLTGEVTVPFSLGAEFSGTSETPEYAWYQRAFVVPTGWHQDRIVLHFGAVDWEAKVWVNGRLVAEHRGGFDPFAIDITEAVNSAVPEQDLVVRVWDPTEGEQMRGSQGASRPEITGIWQSVWIEPVPRRGVTDLLVEPSLEDRSVAVTVLGEDFEGEDMIEVEVLERGGLLAVRRGAVGERLLVPIPGARAWSPEDPFLYDLRIIRSAPAGRVLEDVRSYFGLRTIERRVDALGESRLYLNGEPRALFGVLDPGLWPGGDFTAPTTADLRADISTARAMGFDMIKKSGKVEPELWYRWCDEVGMLVWQDMPAANVETDSGREQFALEMEALLAARGAHPSIIGWTLFDDGSAPFDAAMMVGRVRNADPTRLVTAASGWRDTGDGDTRAESHYPGPVQVMEAGHRLSMLEEFGGLSLALEGHTGGAGYRAVQDGSELAFAYEEYARTVHRLFDEGLDVAVYASLTDLPGEATGLITLDRSRQKADAGAIARANRGEFDPLYVVLATSEVGARTWSYRFEEPAGDWMGEFGPGLDLPGEHGEWSEGEAPFAGGPVCGADARTVWTSESLWLTTEFQVPVAPTGELILRLRHEGPVKVWVNGHLLCERDGLTRTYLGVKTGLSAATVLRPGTNTLSVTSSSPGDERFVDVGLEVLATR